MLRHRYGVTVGVVFAWMALATPAAAQSAGDAAAADALFTEGQKLAAAGRYEEACPKFAESLHLDSGIGVMLYLADCWERTGKTASAWVQFREAEQLATRQSDKRAGMAHQRAARLEPGLARLVIRVGPEAEVAGLELKRDTTAIGRAEWGVAVPVDPGPHSIVASAPGKIPRQTPLLIVAGAAPTVLEITPLDDAKASPVAMLPGPRPFDVDTAGIQAPNGHGRGQRTIGIVVGGVGLVGLVIGSFFGFDTISKNNASNSGHCHPDNTCDGTGLQLRTQAKSSALASTVAFATGATVAAGGVVLYLTAPRSPSPAAVGLAPAPDGRGGALIFSRAW